jgi:hypothetical protein
MEISTGKANYKAAAIATCPRYSRSRAVERPFRYEKLLTRSSRPNDRPGIIG